MDGVTAFVMTHESDPGRTQKSLSVQALTLTRALGRRGVSVVRIHPNRMDIGLSSRYCAAVEVCPDFYLSEERLVEYLEQLSERYPGKRVLIPASDDSALFLSRHWARLAAKYAIPAPNGKVMEKIIDKRLQYAAAEAVGVPIPETHYPASTAEAEALARTLRNFPYVIKPTVAHEWRLASMKRVSQGKKGLRVDTPEELASHYRRLGDRAGEVMLQEIIQGSDQSLFTFIGYLDADSKPLGYCVRSKIRQKPVDFGYCTLTVTCENQMVVDQSLKLLRGMRFHGIVGVEWKLDPRSNQYKLIEINSRAVNTIGIAPACGVDVPYIALCDAVGSPLEPVLRWRSGVKWVRLSQDVLAARTLYRRGQLTLPRWLWSLKGPRTHAVLAFDDLAPVLSMLRQDFTLRLLRWSRRLSPSPG